MFVAGYSMASFAILVSHTMSSLWCEEEAYCVIKRKMLLLLEITLAPRAILRRRISLYLGVRWSLRDNGIANPNS